MIEALKAHLGIVSYAASDAGIDRTTHYDWMKRDPDYKREVEDIQDVALDFAEGRLLRQIKDDDTTATIFYLKTKGKKRGYVERQEVDHSGVLNITWNEVRTYEANDQTDAGT